MFYEAGHDSIMIDKMLPKLVSLAEKTAGENLARWMEAHENDLAEFDRVRRNFPPPPEINSPGDPSAGFPAMEKVGEVVESLLQWTASLRSPYYDDESSPPFEEWKAGAEGWLREIPDTYTVPLSPDALRTEEGDSPSVLVWKGYRRAKNGLLARLHRTADTARHLFGRPPLDRAQPMRTVASRLFFEFHFVLPVCAFLLDRWTEFLKEAAADLQQVHQSTDEETGFFFRRGPTQGSGEKGTDTVAPAEKGSGEQPGSRKEMVRRKVFRAGSPEGLREFLEQCEAGLKKEWALAGTIVRPNRLFARGRLDRRWADLQAAFLRRRAAWARHFRAEREDWQKDLELLNLRLEVNEISEDTVKAFEQKINHEILPKIADPVGLISVSMKKFEKISPDDQTDLKALILQENRSTLRTLRREQLPAILEAAAHAQIEKVLENFQNRINHSVDRLPEVHWILHERDLDSPSPDSKTIEIPLKQLVLEEGYSKLVRRHSRSSEDIGQRLEGFRRSVAEIEQIAAFNLETALDFLEKEGNKGEKKQEARAVAIDGLGRTIQQMTALEESCRVLLEEGRNTIRAASFEFQDQIGELARAETVIDLKLRLARAKAKEEVRDYRNRVLRMLRSVLPAVKANWKEGFTRFRRAYGRIKTTAGLGGPAPRVAEELLQFIAGRQRQIADLPYVYHRLFRIDPLMDERFFEGRKEELDALRAEFTAWQEGRPAVTALVGEKGSGRTTLIHSARRQILKNFPILEIKLAGEPIRSGEALLRILNDAFGNSGSGSLEELETAVRSADIRRVIVVEDLQNMFIRTVEGFDVLERFLLFMSRTHASVFWLITCSLYSWKYLERVMVLSQHFQKVIFLGPLDRESIQSIILKRHRVSGFHLEYEIPEDLAESKRFARLPSDEARRDYLSRMLFDQLNRFASGNVTVAILFWLCAVRKIEKDRLILSPEIRFDDSFLNGLPPDDLFSLAALLQHESLTVSDHAAVFHQDPAESMLQLQQMAGRGLVLEDPKRAFSINPLLYRSIVQALKRKNILY